MSDAIMDVGIMSGNKKIWKISPGDRARQWKIWRERGLAAIGFSMGGSTGDLSQYRTFDELALRYKELGFPKPNYSAKQVWQFVNSIKKGDAIIAYRLYGFQDIGIVEGPCYFEWDELAEDNELYCYRRPVKWLGLKSRTVRGDAAKTYMSRQITLFLITEKSSLKQAMQMLQKSYNGGPVNKQVVQSVLNSSIVDDAELPPKRVKTIDYRIIRDTAKSLQLKIEYQHKCQVCSRTLLIPGKGQYCEVHHIRPLGKSHAGPDNQSNMLCLCPNHHAEMDYAAFYIDPISQVVIHSNPENKYHGKKLRVKSNHKISSVHLKYHRDMICSNWIS